MKKLIFIISLMSLFSVKAKQCVCEHFSLIYGTLVNQGPYRGNWDVVSCGKIPKDSFIGQCYELDEAQIKWPGTNWKS